jgi:O-antigen/teichoic acid export membrane protein
VTGAQGDGGVASAQPRFGRLRARALGLAADPLARSSYSLLANTAANSALGVAFWVSAARLFHPAQVGVDSATIAAFTLLSNLGQFSLSSALERFLPRTGRGARGFVAKCYGIAGAASLLLAGVLIGVSPHVHSLRFLGTDHLVTVSFVAAAIVWTIFALEDNALIGLRRASWVPVENASYGAAKLLFLVIGAEVGLSRGVYAAWIAPLPVVVVVVNLLIFTRVIPHHERTFGHRGPPPAAGTVARFVGPDYFGQLFMQLCTTALPLLVISRFGASANAAFYVALTIALTVDLFSNNLGASLVVEANHAPERLGELLRASVTRGARLITPLILFIVVVAPLLLDVYGHHYRVQGTTELRLLALAAIPRVLLTLFYGAERARGRTYPILFVNAALCALVLGLSWPLMDHFGVVGVAYAFLAANSAVTLAVLPWLLRRMRTVAAPVT